MTELAQQSNVLAASRGRVGMLALIAAETAIFTIFVVAYLFYVGKSTTGPQPRDVLAPPIFFTICLLSSSITLEIALRKFRRDRTTSFATAWLATIVLGGAFLYGTATEWGRLIYVSGLTISTNLFGTTYYSLVGLHASPQVLQQGGHGRGLDYGNSIQKSNSRA